MNQLEIRYHNNRDYQIQHDERLLENGGYQFKHELIDRTLNDFYEFYIDGESLLSTLLPKKSIEWFMSNKNGLLGTNDKVYDELLVLKLLNQKIDKTQLSNHFKKYGIKINDEHLKLLENEYKQYDTVLIYGCKVCGGRDCGGISIEVKEDVDFIYWNTFNENTSKYDYFQFKFNKEDCKCVFNDYLKNWKKARTRSVNYH